MDGYTATVHNFKSSTYMISYSDFIFSEYNELTAIYSRSYSIFRF